MLLISFWWNQNCEYFKIVLFFIIRNKIQFFLDLKKVTIQVICIYKIF